MNSFNHRDHYRDFEIKREQLLQRASREQLMREARERGPRTPQAYRAALTALLASLFR